MNKDDYIIRAQTILRDTGAKFNEKLKNLEEFGVTEAQFGVLVLLSEKKSYKVTDLAEKMEVKPSAVTTMIDRLVNNGLVSRRHDDNDRRAVLISISEKGLEIIKKFEEKCLRMINHYLSRLEPNELEALVKIFEKMNKDT